MVAVAAYHCLQIFFSPLVEKLVVSVFALWHFPFVESLDLNEHAELVAYVQQGGRRRVVRSAYGVCAHFFQYFDLPTRRRDVESRANRAQVVVHANTLKYGLFAV